MALSYVIEGLGVIANADAEVNDTGGNGTGDWGFTGSGGVSNGITQDTYYYGTDSMSMAMSGAKNGWLWFNRGAGLNFVTTYAGQLVYVWIHCPTIGLTGTLANQGVSIRFGTSTTAYRTWTVAGNDGSNGWDGKWKCFVIDPTQAGSVADTGAYAATSVQYFGVRGATTATAKGDNFFISQIAVGSGIRIEGSSTVAWSDSVTYCTDLINRAWGMLQEREGIFYAYGNVIVGDAAAQAAAVSFEDTGRVVQFGLSQYWNGTAWVTTMPLDFCGLTIEDHASFTTTFTDGVIVGTESGRSGTSFVGNDDQNVFVDLYGGSNAASVTSCYGTLFKTITGAFNSGNDAQHAFLSVAFENCAQFDPVGAPLIRNCNFISLFDDGVANASKNSALLWNDNINIQSCNFLANSHAGTDIAHGVEHPIAGSYTYTDLVFSGNEVDIHFSALTGNLVITKSGTSDPVTSTDDSTGTVTITGSVPITLTVKDAAGVLITTAELRIEETNGTLVSQGPATGGNYSASFTGTTPLNVVVKIRSSSTGETRYFPVRTGGTIASTIGLVATYTMTEDTIVGV